MHGLGQWDGEWDESCRVGAVWSGRDGERRVRPWWYGMLTCVWSDSTCGIVQRVLSKNRHVEHIDVIYL